MRSQSKTHLALKDRQLFIIMTANNVDPCTDGLHKLCMVRTKMFRFITFGSPLNLQNVDVKLIKKDFILKSQNNSAWY